MHSLVNKGKSGERIKDGKFRGDSEEEVGGEGGGPEQLTTS